MQSEKPQDMQCSGKENPQNPQDMQCRVESTGIHRTCNAVLVAFRSNTRQLNLFPEARYKTHGGSACIACPVVARCCAVVALSRCCVVVLWPRLSSRGAWRVAVVSAPRLLSAILTRRDGVSASGQP